MTDGRRIQIKGPPEDLEQVRRELVDAGIEIKLVSTAMPGELREPILEALVVTLTSSAAIGAFRSVGERLMLHQERMKALQIYEDERDRELSLEEFLAGKPDA